MAGPGVGDDHRSVRRPSPVGRCSSYGSEVGGRSLTAADVQRSQENGKPVAPRAGSGGGCVRGDPLAGCGGGRRVRLGRYHGLLPAPHADAAAARHPARDPRSGHGRSRDIDGIGGLVSVPLTGLVVGALGVSGTGLAVVAILVLAGLAGLARAGAVPPARQRREAEVAPLDPARQIVAVSGGVTLRGADARSPG